MAAVSATTAILLVDDMAEPTGRHARTGARSGPHPTRPVSREALEHALEASRRSIRTKERHD